MTLSPQFIWNAAAIALGVIGGTLFLWAMFKDRPRGRLRCPKCWYDMKGAVEPGGDGAAAPNPPWICPECGRTIRAAKHLKRTKRRKRFAAIALVAVLISFHVPRLRFAFTRRWPEAIPNLVLVFWPDVLGEYEWDLGVHSGVRVPEASDVTSEMQDEAHLRLVYGRFSRFDEWILTRRMRSLYRKHGFIPLSASDLASIDRIRSTTFTVRDGSINVAELRDAIEPLGLDLWDEFPRRDSTIPWRSHISRSPAHGVSHLIWSAGDPSTQDVSLAETLSGLVLRETWSATDGWVEIKPVEKLHRRVEMYNIRDLTGTLSIRVPLPRLEVIEQVRSVMTFTLISEWWTDNGGDAATIRWFGGRFFIDAPPRMHAEVRDFLAALRANIKARVPLPESTRSDMDRLATFASTSALETSSAPRTVRDAAEMIEQASGRRVIWRFESPFDGRVFEAPVDILPPFTMDSLCQAIAVAAEQTGKKPPTGWTLSDDAIVIGMSLPTEWRMYSLDEILRGMTKLAGSQHIVWDESIQLVMDRITHEVDSPHWYGNGGQTASLLSIDDVLVITATPTMHARIGLLLQDLATNPPAPVTSAADDDSDADPKNRPFDGTFDDE